MARWAVKGPAVISETGRANKRVRSAGVGLCPRESGFTLLEIVVVLALVGIVTGFISLALGDGGQAQRVRETAQLLRQLTEAAADDAVVGNRPVAVVLGAGQVRLREWREGQWQDRPLDRLFRSRRLPADVRVEVSGRDRSGRLGAQVPAMLLPDGTAELLPIEFHGQDGHFALSLVPDVNGYRLQTR